MRKFVILSIATLLSVAPVILPAEKSNAENTPTEAAKPAEEPAEATSDVEEAATQEEAPEEVTEDATTAPDTADKSESALPQPAQNGNGAAKDSTKKTNGESTPANGQSPQKPAEVEKQQEPQKPAEKQMPEQVKEEKKPELPASPAIVAVPERKAEPASVEQGLQLGESDSINIDTFNLEEPRGNWLLKRRWWEESERLYEKIQAISVHVDDLKMNFHQQRSTLDREVFPRFYQQIGIGEGQLNQLLTTLSSNVIDKQVLANKEKEDELERPVINKLKAEKENLERLQKLVKSVETYDIAMQEALLKLREQVKIARRYEVEAWNTFKSIARELSDRKAYEQYYSVKGYLGSIKDIESYIKGPFGDYFNMLDGKIKQEVSQSQKLMIDLQKRGVDLKNDTQALENALQKQKTLEESEETGEDSASQEGSLISYVTRPFVSLWNAIANVFSSLMSLFSTTAEEESSGPAE